VSSPDLSARVAAVRAALRGDVPTVDAQLDLAGSPAALASDAPLWLRVRPVCRSTAADGYLAPPAEPLWLRSELGSAELAGLALEGEGAPKPLVARAVTIVTRDVVWGTAAAPLRKTIARVVLEQEGGPALDVTSAIGEDAARADAAVRAVGWALGRRLGLPVGGDAPPEPAAAPAPPVAASGFARWTLGWEDDRLVLRDLESRGPRESTFVWSAVAATSAAGAVVTLGLFVEALRASAGWPVLAAHGGIAAVFGLGAFAFFHVARHAFRYRAPGTPIAVFADDRVVAAPWVSRRGGIDPRPEGRFGAGVRAHEISRVHVVERAGAHVVSLETDHGPIDITDAETSAQAEHLRSVVEAALAGVASGRKRRPVAARSAVRADAATS
jgi:hypothetical protein